MPSHVEQLAVSSRLNPEILVVLLCYVNGKASESTRLGDTNAIKISAQHSMHIRLTSPVLSASGFSKTHRFVTAIAVMVIIAGLFALGITAPSIDNDDQVLAQSGNSACVTAPLDVGLWGIDQGVLVQWDVCPDEWSSDRRFRYEIRSVIRWRASTIADPSYWARTTNAGSDGEFRITGLVNGLKYAVQLQLYRVEVEVDEQGRFVDERVVARGSWTNSYFATPGTNRDTSCDKKSGAPAEPNNVRLWEHDRGIFVQWDVCPGYRYDIRWRDVTQQVDPFKWPKDMTKGTGSSGQHKITGLTNGQRYAVQLRPTHVQGNVVDDGRWTDDYFAKPARCGDLPGVPTNVEVTSGDTVLTVTWNRCSGARSHIQWKADGGDWSKPIDVGNETSYEIRNLDNGTKYNVQVRASAPSSGPFDKSNGEPYATEWSRAVGETPTSVCPTGKPVEPEEFVVVTGDSKLYVSWRPCPGYEYELAYREWSNTDWPKGEGWQSVATNSSHTIRGLSNNTRYEVRVRIQNDDDTITPEYAAKPQAPSKSNHSPGWKSVPESISLVENRNYDTPIATIEAADPDSGDAIRYEIVKPLPTPKPFPFAINARDGEIYLYDKLDYELIEEYQLKVRAIDVYGAKIEHEIRVEVIDAEGPPPPILHTVCSTGDGIAVAWSGDQSKYSFEIQHRLSTATSFPQRNLHKLDATSRTYSSLTDGSTYVFRVRAIDKSTKEQSKWSSEESVYVSGIANTAPEFRGDSYAFEVVEEQPSGVHVGFTTAIDSKILNPNKPPEDEYEYEYSSVRYRIFESTPEDAPFAVHPFTGIVTTTDRLDYEVQNTYSLVVGATDLCGASDYVDVTITVLDDPNIDATPLVPSAPSIIAKHDQVVVIWPTDHYAEYDLDWREVGEDYRSRPEDADATMPRIVDLPDTDSSYAFRLRRVNQLGEPGEWSPETIVDPECNVADHRTD